MKLTKSYIDSLTYQGSGNAAQIHWDERIDGFGLRVYPSGKKAFVFKYRYGGRQRMPVLGKYGAITLHQALQLAQQRYIELKSGKDPKTEAERAKMAGKTVADLAEHYYNNHAKLRKKSHRNDKIYIDKWIKPKLGKLAVREVQESHVSRLHTEYGRDHPTAANRMLATLSKMFNEAARWGFVEKGHPNPCAGIEKFDEVSRDRYITKLEMPKLAERINKLDDPYCRALIWLYLLTGLRKNELLSLKWADVDLEEKRIRIGVTKNGSPHYLPLISIAARLVASLPRLADNPYVFPGRKPGEHRQDFRRQWDAIRKKTEITDIRVHDLRRTVGSLMVQQGNSLALIGKVLNHASPKTTQIYARFADEPVRKALEEHGKAMEAVIEVQE